MNSIELVYLLRKCTASKAKIDLADEIMWHDRAIRQRHRDYAVTMTVASG